MKISVIICTINRDKELKKCLFSLKNQSRRPDEIIIVSNKKYRIPGAKIYTPNTGLPQARNLGLSKTDADIIFFFDDDTIVDRDYIKNVIKVFEEHPDAGGVTGRILERKKHRIKTGLLGRIMKLYARLFGISGFFVNLDGIGRVLDTGFTVTNFEKIKFLQKVEILSGCNMAYSRKAIEKTGLFDEGYIGNAYYEDADYSYRVFLNGFSLYATPDAVVDHIVTPTNRASLPKLKYFQLVNQKRFFRKNVYRGSIKRLVRYKISRWALFIPILVFSIYFKNLDMIKYYIKAELR